jgi:hypothetical protein
MLSSIFSTAANKQSRQEWLRVALEAIASDVPARGVGVCAEHERYRNDPVGFATEVLGETFTPDVIRVMESVRDYPITIAKSGNGTGKTYGGAHIALWWYLCHLGAQVYMSAAPPEDNLRNLLWGELGGILAKHPQLLAGHRTRDLRISRSDKEFITGVTIPSSGSPVQRQARFSGKHAPYLLFIVDEGDAVPDFVYRGIESCLSGGVGRLLIMFNPRARIGPVYRMERLGIGHVVEMTAFTHPNVVTGEDLIPGAVDRATTVRRINEWTRPLLPHETPDSQCFQVPDYLVGVVGTDRLHRPYLPLPASWRKITDNQFSHMVLARYPASSTDQLISEEWIDAAVTRWHSYVARFGELPPKGSKAILGVDVGEMGSDISAVALRYGGWVPHFITWTGVDVLVSGEKIAELFIEYNGMRINVDSTGVGAGVAPQAARSLRAKGVRLNRSEVNRVMVAESPTKETEHGQFAMLRDQLLWELRDWLREDPGAMLPPDDELREELLAFSYETNQKGKIKVTDKASLRVRLGRSPNKADALALTFASEGRKLALAFI